MSEFKGPHVTHSPVRCPYCHETVDLGDGPWVACSGCLARHHADCWMGQGGCASCLGQRALLPPSALRATRDRLRRREPRTGRALAFGALLLSAQVGVALVGLALMNSLAVAEVQEAPAAVAPSLMQSTLLDPLQVNAILRAEEAKQAEPSAKADAFRVAHADLRAIRDELVRRETRVESAKEWIARSGPAAEPAEELRRELRLTYAAGTLALEEKQYPKAIKHFERILDTIRWCPYDLAEENLTAAARSELERARREQREAAAQQRHARRRADHQVTRGLIASLEKDLEQLRASCATERRMRHELALLLAVRNGPSCHAHRGAPFDRATGR